MFTKRVFTSAIRSSSCVNPILWRNFCTNFEPIRIKNIGTQNVSYHDIINANVTLTKHKIDMHLSSKEIQEKINLNNDQSNELTLIKPLFMLLNNNGTIIDAICPKDINDGCNQLETFFCKTPELTIDFRKIEKSTNENKQWHAYYNIRQISDTQSKINTTLKSKINTTMKSPHDDHGRDIRLALMVEAIIYIAIITAMIWGMFLVCTFCHMSILYIIKSLS